MVPISELRTWEAHARSHGEGTSSCIARETRLGAGPMPATPGGMLIIEFASVSNRLERRKRGA